MPIKEYSQEEIQAINSELANERKNFCPKEGYERIIHSLVTQIKDLFGKNTVLSMTYQMGRDAGLKIAQTVLEKREMKKFEDPVIALQFLMNLLRDQYAVQIEGIKTNLEENEITITLKNTCFFRELTENYDDIRAGGPICRVSKGYFETALTAIVKPKIKVFIGFTKEIPEEHCCFEFIKIQFK